MYKTMAKKMNKKMTQGMVALAVVLLVVYVLKVRGLVEFKKKRVCGRSQNLMNKLKPNNVMDTDCGSKCREHDPVQCNKDMLNGNCTYKKYVKRGKPPMTVTMPLKQACQIRWV
jgi:hypothetical protein